MIIKFRPLDLDPRKVEANGSTPGLPASEAVWGVFQDDCTGSLHFNGDSAVFYADQLAGRGQHAQVWDGDRLYYEVPKPKDPPDAEGEPSPTDDTALRLEHRPKALRFRQHHLLNALAELAGEEGQRKFNANRKELFWEYAHLLRHRGYLPEPPRQDDHPHSDRETHAQVRQALSVSEWELSAVFLYRAMEAENEDDRERETERAEYWAGKAQERFELAAWAGEGTPMDERMHYPTDYREKPVMGRGRDRMTLAKLRRAMAAADPEEYRVFLGRVRELHREITALLPPDFHSVRNESPYDGAGELRRMVFDLSLRVPLTKAQFEGMKSEMEQMGETWREYGETLRGVIKEADLDRLAAKAEKLGMSPVHAFVKSDGRILSTQTGREEAGALLKGTEEDKADGEFLPMLARVMDEPGRAVDWNAPPDDLSARALADEAFQSLLRHHDIIMAYSGAGNFLTAHGRDLVKREQERQRPAHGVWVYPYVPATGEIGERFVWEGATADTPEAEVFERFHADGDLQADLKRRGINTVAISNRVYYVGYKHNPGRTPEEHEATEAFWEEQQVPMFIGQPGVRITRYGERTMAEVKGKDAAPSDTEATAPIPPGEVPANWEEDEEFQDLLERDGFRTIFIGGEVHLTRYGRRLLEEEEAQAQSVTEPTDTPEDTRQEEDTHHERHEPHATPFDRPGDAPGPVGPADGSLPAGEPDEHGRPAERARE